MKSLTFAEAAEWCTNHGLALGAQRFPAQPAKVDTFRIPEDAGAKIALVAGDLHGLSDASEILVWVAQWGVWPSSERQHIFDRFRLSYGERRGLHEVPAFLFERGEFEDAVSCATLGVLFLWDIHVLAPQEAAHLYYSHDEVGWRAVEQVDAADDHRVGGNRDARS